MKRIGIIGGISYKSTIKYYDLIMQKYFNATNNAYFPEIIIFSLSFQKFADFEKHGDKDGYLRYILEGIKALQKSNVDFILISANSPHAIYDKIQEQTDIPILSIVETTTRAVKQENVKTILLIGIKFTLQSGFYQKILEKEGIKVILPTENEQDVINKIIFDELNIGIVKEESRDIILKIIDNYNIDGVIVGCTVLPTLIQQKHLKTKLFDTTELHTDAAVAELFK